MPSLTDKCRKWQDDGWFRYGAAVSQCPWLIMIGITLVQFCGIYAWVRGGDLLPMETRIQKLWSEVGGRVEDELDHQDRYENHSWAKQTNLVIFTPLDASTPALSEAMLDDYVLVYKELLKLTITSDKAPGLVFSLAGLLIKGEDWSVAGAVTANGYNLCDFVPFPDELIPRTPPYDDYVFKYTPCNRVTLLDCFLEGGMDFPLGFPGVVGSMSLIEALGATKGEMMDEFGLLGYDRLPSYKGKDPAQLTALVKRGCTGYVQNLMDWKPNMLFGGIEWDDAVNRTSIKSVKAFQVIMPMASPASVVAKLARPPVNGPAPPKDLTAKDVYEMQQNFSMLLEARVDELNRAGVLKAARIEALTAGAFDRVISEFSAGSNKLIMLGYVLMTVYVILSQLAPTWSHMTVFEGLIGLVLVLLGNVFCLAMLVLGGWTMNATVLNVLPFVAQGLGIDIVFVFLAVYREVLDAHPGLNTKATIALTCKSSGTSVTLTSFSNGAAFMMGWVIPLPAVRVFCVSAFATVAANWVLTSTYLPCILAIKHRRSKSGRASNADQSMKGHEGSHNQDGEENRYQLFKTGFLYAYYIPFLQTRAVQLLGAAFFVGLTTLGIVLSSQVEDGLSILDVVPEGSPLYRATKTLQDNFYISPAQVSFQNITYGDPRVQKHMVDMMNAINVELPFVNSGDCAWVRHLAGAVTAKPGFDNRTVSPEYNGYFSATPAQFKQHLTEFTNPDKATFLQTFQDGMLMFGYDDADNLMYSFCGFMIVGQSTTKMMVDALERTRDFTDKWCNANQPVPYCYPQGTIFTFWGTCLTEWSAARLASCWPATGRRFADLT